MVGLNRILIRVALLIALVSCCTININNNGKLYPEYNGVDPNAAPYVNKWLDLAKERGLKFDDVVTIGFKSINQDRVIGVCNYGPRFREIDLDIGRWENFTVNTRTALVWHEMSHCYCNRGHDYGNGKDYGEAEKAIKVPMRGEGFFDDGCPWSIMYPIVVEDSCFLSHYNEYVDEMFENCEEF